MEAIFSKKGDTQKVSGQFFVTYTAERFGKKYTAIHLNPCGGGNSGITADELNEEWNKKYKGLCPFNGDKSFEVVKIQKRTQF